MLEAMILDEFGGRKAEGKGLCGPLGIELARKGRLQHVSFYRAGDKAAWVAGKLGLRRGVSLLPLTYLLSWEELPLS